MIIWAANNYQASGLLLLVRGTQLCPALTPNVDLKNLFRTDVFDVENAFFDVENGISDVEKVVFDVENAVFDVENIVFDVENVVFDIENQKTSFSMSKMMAIF